MNRNLETALRIGLPVAPLALFFGMWSYYVRDATISPFILPACAMCSSAIRSTTRRAASVIAAQAGDAIISPVNQIQGSSAGGALKAKRSRRAIGVALVAVREPI